MSVHGCGQLNYLVTLNVKLFSYIYCMLNYLVTYVTLFIYIYCMLNYMYLVTYVELFGYIYCMLNYLVTFYVTG